MAKTNYLRFNADSMASALKRKLGENSSFTDQMYPGSDLSILIETLSYLFEMETYLLNSGASESVYTDSKLFENLNRVVKMIGYSPVGYIPAQVVLGVQNKSGLTTVFFSDETKLLPKYTTITTDLTDNLGKPITYTFKENIDISTTNEENNTTTYNAVNGKWKLLNTTLLAYGLPNESFVLNSVDLNVTYVAHNYMSVFVKRFENGVFVYKEFIPVTDGFTFATPSSIVGANDQVFELRINENMKYELVFGDGIHGMGLQENDELYVVYLECNGVDGAIGANVINTNNPLTIGIDGLSMDIFYEFIGTTSATYTEQYVSPFPENNELARFYFFNPKSSTEFTDMESVDEIKTNAPFWFRTGGVLQQDKDYKKWFLSGAYKNLFYDVSVMNNEKYISKFMAWMASYNRLTLEGRKNNYLYADACDFNNIYIWVKQKYDIDFDPIYDDLEKVKVLTSSPVIVNSINLFFIPGLFYEIDDSRLPTQKYLTKGVYRNIDQSLYVNEDELQLSTDNWIEVIKDKTTYISSEKIKQNVVNEIKRFFLPQNNKLGQVVNINQLYINLINIPGVKNIRTCFRDNVNNRPQAETYYYNGISFIAYTKMILNGADTQIMQGSVKIQDFQFPTLAFETSLIDKVVVISESNQSNISI